MTLSTAIRGNKSHKGLANFTTAFASFVTAIQASAAYAAGPSRLHPALLLSAESVRYAYAGRAALRTQGQVGASLNAVTIYSFVGGKNGAQPTGGLAPIGASLYGTTTMGGACGNPAGCGTIYRVGEASAPGKTVGWYPVYAFTGGSDGAEPHSGLTAIGNQQVG